MNIVSALIKKNGYSLVEIVVSSLIFSIAAAGLLSLFASQRETSDRGEKRLLAAYYGRQVLEELRAKVDQRNWNAGTPNWWNLNCDDLSYAWPGSLPPSTLHNAQVNYTCTEILPPNPAAGSRKFTLTIKWDEP